MSSFTPQGPYGPDNPPPPPQGSPPGKAGDQRGRGESDGLPPARLHQDSEGARNPGRAFMHRKLNNRQRKKFRQAQQGELHEGKDRDRSRSPAPSGRRGSFGYRERSSARHGVNQKGPGSTSSPRNGRQKCRNSLRHARQFTPDQIIDETHGRLSPPRASHGYNQYQRGQTDLERSKQIDWSDDKPNPWSSEPEPYRWEGTSLPGETSTPAWHAAASGRTEAVRPEMHQQPGGIEDEVDWDDGELFSQSVPARAYDAPDNDGFRSQHPAYQVHDTKSQESAYQSEPRYASAQAPERSASPAQNQPDWQEATWEETEERSLPLRSRAGNAEPQMSGVPSDKTNKGRAGMGAAKPQRNHRDRFRARNSFSESGADHPTSLARPSRPDTVYNLRHYDAHIMKLHRNLPKHKAYRNGNGKAAPRTYGARPSDDLGLCFVTFCTDGWCEMGIKCAWRHHPLTKTEREWIAQLGEPRGKTFLEELPRHWSTPEVPVPGANMEEKAGK